MDKYEYRIKLEEIEKLVAKNDYLTAMDIADTISWNKVRNVATLCLVSEIYEKNEKLETSLELLRLAYDRSPIGRLILSRLVEVEVKLNNFSEAIDYYKEFVEIAPTDPMRYILRYKILRGKRIPPDELIDLLRRFKDIEYHEEWAYELAHLYHEAGKIADCVEECDEIILWFNKGKYVEKAMELKMLYEPLTLKQQEKYDSRNDEVEDVEQEDQEDQVEANSEEREEIGEAESIKEIVEAEILTDMIEEVSSAPDMCAEEIEKEPEADPVPMLADADEKITLPVPAEADPEDLGARVAKKEKKQNGRGRPKTALKWLFPDKPEKEVALKADTKELPPWEDWPTADELETETEPDMEEQENCDIQIVPVTYGKYDTLNLQEELAKNMQLIINATEKSDVDNTLQNMKQMVEKSEMSHCLTDRLPYIKEESTEDNPYGGLLSEGQDGQLNLVVKDEKILEKQITGQLCIEEVLAEWERVQAEKNKKFEAAKQRALDEAEDILMKIVAAVPEISTNVKKLLTEIAQKNAVNFESFYTEDEKDTICTETEFLSSREEVHTESVLEPLQEKITTETSETGSGKEKELHIIDTSKRTAVAETAETVNEVSGGYINPVDSDTEIGLGSVDLVAAIDNAMINTAEAIRAKRMQKKISGKKADIQPIVTEGIAEGSEIQITEEITTEKSNIEMKTEDDISAEKHEIQLEAENTVEDCEVQTGEQITVKDYEIQPEMKTAVKDCEIQPEMKTAVKDCEIQPEAKTVVEACEVLPEVKIAEEACEMQPKAELAAESCEMQNEPDHIQEGIEQVINSSEEVEAQSNEQLGEPSELSSEKVEINPLTKEQAQELGSFLLNSKIRLQMYSLFEKINSLTEEELEKLKCNLVVTGSDAVGKTTLAISVFKLIQKRKNKNSGKFAKITAREINQQDVAAVINKIAGGVLLIANAENLSEGSVAVLHTALQDESQGISIILEGKQEKLYQMLEQHNDFKQNFYSMIHIPTYSRKELVEFGKQYAYKEGAVIDEMGVLALYTSLSDNEHGDHRITLEEIKEIIDCTIKRAEKKKIKSLFKKRFDAEGYLLLRETDFPGWKK